MIIVGLLSFIAYWVFVVRIFRRWGFDHTLTISEHVIVGDQRKYYNPRAMFVLSFYVMYLLFSLLPKYEAGLIEYALVVIAWFSELLAIQFPRFGRHFVFHDKLVQIVGSCLYILIALLGFSGNQNTSTRYLSGVSLVVIAISSVPILHPKKKRNLLFFQSFFFAAMQVSLLLFGVIN